MTHPVGLTRLAVINGGDKRPIHDFNHTGTQPEAGRPSPGGSRHDSRQKQEKFMKYLVQTACAAMLIGLSGNVYAAVNGINYDPAHNPDWEQQRSAGNVEQMKKMINKDLGQITAMGFTAIKTYYSTFCTNKPECIDIAAYANQQYPTWAYLSLLLF
jgi:hypothetical protein